MKKLFASLPYIIKTRRDADMLVLTCNFKEAAPPPVAGPEPPD
jgi:hypothetical protein